MRVECCLEGGFRYRLLIAGEEIERDVGIVEAGLSGDVGTRFVRVAPTRRTDGRGGYTFGMTLANCGMRSDGVVVIDLDPGLAAAQAGLLVGDILLSIDDEQALDTRVILDKLRDAREEVTLEVAGATPSQLITLPNPGPNPYRKDGAGSISLADTACGVGIYVASVEQWTSSESPGTGRLATGDVVLSVDGAVTESSKETAKYLRYSAGRTISVVIAGRGVGALGEIGAPAAEPEAGASIGATSAFPENGA